MNTCSCSCRCGLTWTALTGTVNKWWPNSSLSSKIGSHDVKTSFTKIGSHHVIISFNSWLQWSNSWSQALICLTTSPFLKLIFLFQGQYTMQQCHYIKFVFFSHPHVFIDLYLLWCSHINSCCFKPRRGARTTSGSGWAGVWGETEGWFLHRSRKLWFPGELWLTLLGAEAWLDWLACWARPHCLWCGSDQVNLTEFTNFIKCMKQGVISTFNGTLKSEGLGSF